MWKIGQLLETLSENPLFTRQVKWRYTKKAGGAPKTLWRVPLAAAGQFVTFAILLRVIPEIEEILGVEVGAIRLLGIYVLSGLVAYYARGFYVPVGGDTDAIARLRAESKNGTLESLYLARLTSREAFVGLAGGDYLRIALMLIEGLPLALLVPMSFWTGEIGLPAASVWLVVPLGAADLALHLMAVNLIVWRVTLSGESFWRPLTGLRRLSYAAIWFLNLAAVIGVWVYVGRGWNGLAAVAGIEAISAYFRVRYSMWAWKWLTENFWEQIRVIYLQGQKVARGK